MQDLNNLTDLAAVLRQIAQDDSKTEIAFDMNREYEFRGSTDHPCGSACCIGGWVQLLRPELRDKTLIEAVHAIAPSISVSEIDQLCWPESDTDETSYVWAATPEQAALAVEILRDTGKCDWDRAMAEGAA